MKVAIPEWQGRISPVFDVAATLVVADVVDAQAVEQRTVRLFCSDLHGRVMELAGMGVDVLICGAISWPFEMALSNEASCDSPSRGEVQPFGVVHREPANPNPF